MRLVNLFSGKRARSGERMSSVAQYVPSAVAATRRTSVELLTLPYPFSQVFLIDADDFIKEVDKRQIRMSGGWRLNISGLQELHRQGLLIPFFGIDLSPGDAAKAIDVSESITWRQVHHTVVSELYSAASQGRLIDPNEESFTPWPTERVRQLWPSVARGYLYSPHQLLSLLRIKDYVALLEPWRVKGTTEWRIRTGNLPDSRSMEAIDSWRSCAITLSALDTGTWPGIVNSISNDVAEWQRSSLIMPPRDLLEWLGLSSE
jgi:hypothetical protein